MGHPDIQQYIDHLPENYLALSLEERLAVLPKLVGKVPVEIFEDEMTRYTLGSIYAMQSIQRPMVKGLVTVILFQIVAA